MKKFLFVFALIPTLSFAQDYGKTVEQYKKETKKSGPKKAAIKDKTARQDSTAVRAARTVYAEGKYGAEVDPGKWDATDFSYDLNTKKRIYAYASARNADVRGEKPNDGPSPDGKHNAVTDRFQAAVAKITLETKFVPKSASGNQFNEIGDFLSSIVRAEINFVNNAVVLQVVPSETKKVITVILSDRKGNDVTWPENDIGAENDLIRLVLVEAGILVKAPNSAAPAAAPVNTPGKKSGAKSKGGGSVNEQNNASQNNGGSSGGNGKPEEDGQQDGSASNSASSEKDFEIVFNDGSPVEADSQKFSGDLGPAALSIKKDVPIKKVVKSSAGSTVNGGVPVNSTTGKEY